MLTSLINRALFLGFPLAMLAVRRDESLAGFFRESLGFLGDMVALFLMYSVAFRGAKLRTGGSALGLVKFVVFVLLWILISHIQEKQIPLDGLQSFLSSPETLLEIVLLRGPRALVLSGLLFLGFSSVMALPFVTTGALWVVYFAVGQVLFNEAVDTASKIGAGFDLTHPAVVASCLKFARYLVEPLQAIAVGQVFFFRFEVETLLVATSLHIVSYLAATFVLANQSAGVVSQVIQATAGVVQWTAGKEQQELAFLVSMLVNSFNIHLSQSLVLVLARVSGNKKRLQLTPWSVYGKQREA